MKDYTKAQLIIVITVFILAIICFTIGFTSCMIYDYPSASIYSPNYVHPSVQAMRDQDAIGRANAIKYAEEHYGGKAAANPTNSPKANSIIGTSYDSFNNVRTSKIGVSVTKPTQDIRLYIK